MSEDPQSARLFVSPHAGRIDRLVAEHCGIGRRRARELIAHGWVRLDGRACRAGTNAPAGAGIEVRFPETTTESRGAAVAEPRERPRVLWRGGDVVAFYKPRGFHSHRGRGRPTLADFVTECCPSAAAVGRLDVECGLVHRLDRDTSGVMLAATTMETYERLRAAFAAGLVLKEYLALVRGALTETATVDVPLTRRPTRVRPARAGEPALDAVTTITPLELGESWTLVRAAMHTGVTHQIRAHLALVGHAVVGDQKYGPTSDSAATNGHLLHAQRLTLPDGTSLAVDPGEEFLETLAALRGATRAPTS